MIEAVKRLVLRVMKVPPEPSRPAGREESVEVFRASKRFFYLNLLRWFLAQFSTLVGIVFALGFLHSGGEAGLEEMLRRLPVGEWIAPLVYAAEAIGIGAYLLQLPFSFFVVLLDWQMRWYIVTDRSLRIREGVVNVKEMTLTFANVQEVSIHQGPLQRLLGISDLKVRTAGGGGGTGPPAKQRQQEAHSPHIGYFHGVDNAETIRDLILKRLKVLRDAGLGDPDQEPFIDDESVTDGPSAGVVPAAEALLEEVRRLRRAAL